MRSLVLAIWFLPFIYSYTFSNFKYSGKSQMLNWKCNRVNKHNEITTLKATVPLRFVSPLAINAKRLLERFFTLPMSRIGVLWRAIIVIFAAFISKTKAKVKAQINFATDAMEQGWTKRGTGSAFSRTIEVWIFAITFLIRYKQTERLKNGDATLYSQKKKEIASFLRDKLLALGPTFIKLGQLLSTRIDVFPKEYIEALELLQDKVPGFPGDLAVKIIQQELGRPITELYDSFNTTALAAASLGQVHIAELNGKKLAIKVQRQGLKELFDMDLKNIKVLAKLLDKFDPKTDGAQRDWDSIYDESAKLLYKEIDYQAEALNCVKFKENFANIPWIKVPEVMLNMTSKKVITMEYVPGIKINDIKRIEEAGIDRKVLAKRSAESYLTQICRHGFFHCDPHPGNVACDEQAGGRLIYYDFGMMDELKPEVRAGLVDLIFGVYEVETKEVCDALERIGVLRKGVDRVSIENIARFFLQEFSRGVSDGKWSKDLSEEEKRELVRKRRQQLGSDLFSVGSDVPFQFPPTFTFVFRAFTSLDGIGKGLDPAYDLTRLAQPFLKELIDLKDGSATISFMKSWGKKLGWRPIDIENAITSPRKIANLNNIVTRMEQGELKVRVRVLESERAFQQMEIAQNNMALLVATSSLINLGVLLLSKSGGSNPLTAAISKASFILAGICGIQIPIGAMKVASLKKKFGNNS